MQPVPNMTALPMEKKLKTFPRSSPSIGSHLCQSTSKRGNIYDTSTRYHTCIMNSAKDIDDISSLTLSRKTPSTFLDNSVIAKRTKKLRSLQQQLLLLHHAGTCKHASKGSLCPTTRHCARTQMLWNHIATCPNTETCSVKSCRSSRVLLNHFMKCTSKTCQICLPTRMVIARTQENKRLDDIQLKEEQKQLCSMCEFVSI